LHCVGKHEYELEFTLLKKLVLGLAFCVYDSNFFNNSFQNDEEWHLFYCNSNLGWQVIQDLDLCKLKDL